MDTTEGGGQNSPATPHFIASGLIYLCTTKSTEGVFWTLRRGWPGIRKIDTGTVSQSLFNRYFINFHSTPFLFYFYDKI